MCPPRFLALAFLSRSGMECVPAFAFRIRLLFFSFVGITFGKGFAFRLSFAMPTSVIGKVFGSFFTRQRWLSFLGLASSLAQESFDVR